MDAREVLTDHELLEMECIARYAQTKHRGSHARKLEKEMREQRAKSFESGRRRPAHARDARV